MKRFRILILSILLFIGGCSVKYTVEPVGGVKEFGREICVIEDTKVRDEFLIAYKSSLEDRGFTVKILQPGSQLDSCELTSTYLGRWSWDFVTYMAYAKIVIYKNGIKYGEALYEAPRAGFALTTEIYEETEVKIKSMVDKLFPNA